MIKCNKKVLIIDAGDIARNGGTGETLRSLFSVFPKENIFNLCLNPNVEISNNEYIDRVHIIPEKCLFIRYILQKTILRKKELKKSNVADYQSNDIHINSSKKRIFSDLSDLFFLTLDKKTKKLIKEFKPDIIYTTGNSIRTFKYVLKISRIFDLKVLPHYMDDYIFNNSYEYCGIFKFLNNIVLKLNERCIKRANSILCISQKMAEEYQEKFNKTSFVARNTVTIGKINLDSPHKPLRILYAGSMNLNRDIILIELCKVIDKINKEQLKVNLEIYSSGSLIFSNFFENSNIVGVTLNNYIDHDLMLEKINLSDICLYAENLNEESKKYCRLSFSTKIAEYMSFGKPIMCISPDGTAVYDYLKTNNFAYLISNLDDLEKNIHSMFDRNIYLSKSKISYDLFLNDMSFEVILKNFIDAFNYNI